MKVPRSNCQERDVETFNLILKTVQHFFLRINRFCLAVKLCSCTKKESGDPSWIVGNSVLKPLRILHILIFPVLPAAGRVGQWSEWVPRHRSGQARKTSRIFWTWRFSKQLPCSIWTLWSYFAAIISWMIIVI